MRITSGATRLVILTDDWAIKLPKFRIWRLFLQLCRGLFDWKWLTSKMEGDSGAAAVLANHAFNHFFAGLMANRQENRLYRDHPGLPIAPVRGMYLFGLVLVMVRGEAVSPALSARFRAQYAAWGDLGEPHHACHVRGELCLIDYGHPLAPTAFGV